MRHRSRRISQRLDCQRHIWNSAYFPRPGPNAFNIGEAGDRCGTAHLKIARFGTDLSLYAGLGVPHSAVTINRLAPASPTMIEPNHTSRTRVRAAIAASAIATCKRA